MARCSRYRPVIFILLALLHIIHFSAAGRAGILKFEDVDRWLLDEQAFQARASLSDSAAYVASFSLPKDAEVFPQLQLADQESSERLGSEYYKLDGLRLGTNWVWPIRPSKQDFQPTIIFFPIRAEIGTLRFIHSSKPAGAPYFH